MQSRLAFGVFVLLLFAALSGAAQADPTRQTKAPFQDAFRQLEGEDWPTPTDYRNAAGAPGHRYWQQQVDYRIAVTLDEPNRTLNGRQEVVYRNNSPDSLSYLWLLLDQNNYKRNSLAERTRTVPNTPGKISLHELQRIQRFKAWEGGHAIRSVTGADGQALPFTVVDTLMRIDLPRPLASGEQVSFALDWSVALPETKVVDGRGGYECFTKPGEDGNCLFLAAQWFPRLAVYSDYEGWHNKAFLGSGEFTLEFGDYDVSITVPADHVVSSTGELANPDILTGAQRERLARARTASAPVYVVTPEEAAAAERGRASGTRTWSFRARNVRDFAWASSRKFIWDAMGVKQDDVANPLVMAMSFFPKEARPLWDAYSTKAIAHTIDVYGEFAFPYPYPVAQSVNGPVGGMEYPMMSFNGPRPVKDKKTGVLTYTERAKTGLIGVVIHEIGHIWFPMAVNSDERQWTWLDEGVNTFLQFQAEKQWDADFPTRRGEPEDIVEYMVSQNQVPIMVQSDSLLQFGANSYAKPATALVVLRETVLGRELFDKAFRDYATRWRFKRPTPYDFFRTMEESSGVDLDWFWRGWFYSTDHVDIALENVVQARVDTLDPDVEYRWRKAREDEKPPSLTVEGNRREGERTVTERDPATRDYYDRTDRLAPTQREREKAAAALADLEPDERAALQAAARDNLYHFSFRNVGGVVMPIPLRLTYTDGTSEFITVPAEVWRRNAQRVVWQHVTAKTLAAAELDPRREIADADRANNRFPQAIQPVTLKAEGDEPGPNRMRDNDRQVTPDSLQTRPAPKPR